MHQRYEILAPAGSMESFHAAIRARADAIYLGGNRFSARAFANNFSEQELLDLIDYAHLHGVKVYLTVNTLLKDSEIKDLYEYIVPLYKQGLDAVIVQDVGVAYYLQQHLPLLELHASTQMTITNHAGATFLKSNGFQRVVPARELSLQEVADIVTYSGVEVECFVHGALCYCYSGQCLMSSLIGGRSGNRGQCAQPCRLQYKMGGRKQYYLSLKDLNTLDVLPDLMDAGISSFKIEGRMKKPEYVGLVTSIYVKYRDIYVAMLEGNRQQKLHDVYQVESQDQIHLMDIFNRGGFTEGYYHQHNSQSMLSFDRPNHAGTPILQVLKQVGREMHVLTLLPIAKGDIIDLNLQSSTESSYTCGQAYPLGSTFVILLPKGVRIKVGHTLNRVRNQELIDRVQTEVLDIKPVIRVLGEITLKVGHVATLAVWYKEHYVQVFSSQEVQQAKQAPMTRERIEQQLRKTGSTEYIFDHIEVNMEGQVFISMMELNQLRRDALEAIEKAIVSSYHRMVDAPIEEKQKSIQNVKQQDPSNNDLHIIALSIQIDSLHQLRAIDSYTCYHRIYVPIELLLSYADICQSYITRGIELYLTTPILYREAEGKQWFQDFGRIPSSSYHGILVSNMELYQMIRSIKMQDTSDIFDKDIILDHNLYIFNEYSRQFWNTNQQYQFTAPYELNQAELTQLNMFDMELVIYGRIPVMITAQCLTEELEGCTHIPQVRMMEDRMGCQLPVKNACRYCYNVIYSHQPMYLFDLNDDIQMLKPKSTRITFTTETWEEVVEVMDCYDSTTKFDSKRYSRGHFRRGVQ